MDQELTGLLKRVRELLSANERIRSIFRAEDCREGFFRDGRKAAVLRNVPKSELWKRFHSNLDYLIEYVEKSSNENQEEFPEQAEIFDLHLCIHEKVDHHIYTEEEAELALQVGVLLLVLSIASCIEKDISELITEDLTILYPARENRNHRRTFYRGHANKAYKLLPTIFRGYRPSIYGNPFVYSTLYKLYQETGLLNKFAMVFPGFTRIDTIFCAYMQHSTSFSPFLDITEDHRVALSFATQLSGNRNEYLNTDAALFRFEFSNDALVQKREADLGRMQIYFFNDRFSLMTKFEERYLWECSPETFAPSIELIGEKSNDRMRYQKGAFLFFRRAIVVNSQILLPYTVGNIRKYIIPANKKPLGKQGIYNSVKTKYPYYDSEHLMNPYLVFAEN